MTSGVLVTLALETIEIATDLKSSRAPLIHGLCYQER
jgi:hypothetical protein